MAHLRLLVVVAAALVASTRGEWNTTSVVLDPLARRLGLADEGAVKSWRAAVDEGQKAILKLYQAKHEDFLDITFYDDKQGAHRVRERLLRALVLSDTFVITIGGMSDVAGHGNLFSQSYPNVMKDALKAVFDKTPIKFNARNMAMGGVPSYPNSVCMTDTFGADSDVIVWDFRMVERDADKGELYIRQALMLPRGPSIVFKRKQGYLQSMKYAWTPGSLSVIDENKLNGVLVKAKAEAVLEDNFCENTCKCPGQVRWHAGWKMQRLRGMQLAYIYLQYLGEAVDEYAAAVKAGKGDALLKRDWALPVHKGKLPKALSKEAQPYFSETFRCTVTWGPKLCASPLSILDAGGGYGDAVGNTTKWTLDFANAKTKSMTEKGHADCGYKDEKKSLIGDVNTGWVFFLLKDVPDGGTVAFCGDFPDEKDVADYLLVLVNGEEVQGDLDQWMTSKTLGISSTCFASSAMVRAGENVIGFRVMQPDIKLMLTHVLRSD